MLNAVGLLSILLFQSLDGLLLLAVVASSRDSIDSVQQTVLQVFQSGQHLLLEVLQVRGFEGSN